MRTYTIHKPTHKWFGPKGTPAIAIGQLRGDSLVLNRIGPDGTVCEKSWAVGSCAHHLTGYGKGVEPHEALSVDSMQNAWRFTFGLVPLPDYCERHGAA